MRINKEGYKIICISGAVCVFIFWLIYHLLVSDSNVSLLWVSAVLLLLFWFFIVAFFREPRRVRIHDADLVFSPCDGRVVVTEVVKETEYLNEEMLQISIFMSVTNVHMNWVPVGGTVEYFKYHPGRFLVPLFVVLAFRISSLELNNNPVHKPADINPMINQTTKA